MCFRLVPKSVTLNDLERRNGRYFALFQRIRVASGAHFVKVHVRYLISWWVLVNIRYIYYFATGSVSKNCNERVCTSHYISNITRSNFTKLSVSPICVLNVAVALVHWWQCNTLCTSGFVDDVMLPVIVQAKAAPIGRILLSDSITRAADPVAKSWSLQLPCYELRF